MENLERSMGNQLESNAELYPGTIIEKSGDHAVDLEKAVKALRIVKALEQQE